ncbi:MAG: hypothetical protein ABIB43_06070 [archaeon]
MDEQEQQYISDFGNGVGPYSCDISEYYDGCYVPAGRGIPIDRANTGADCGPSAIAAYLQISTAEAIDLLPLWKEKKRHSSKRTLDALAQIGNPHKLIQLGKKTKSLISISDKFPTGFAEVRFLKYDKQEFSTKHTIAYDQNKNKELLIYDCNARSYGYDKYSELDGIQGIWVSEDFWSANILRWGENFLSKKPINFYLSHILVPVDKN